MPVVSLDLVALIGGLGVRQMPAVSLDLGLLVLALLVRHCSSFGILCASFGAVFPPDGAEAENLPGPRKRPDEPGLHRGQVRKLDVARLLLLDVSLDLVVVSVVVCLGVRQMPAVSLDLVALVGGLAVRQMPAVSLDLGLLVLALLVRHYSSFGILYAWSRGAVISLDGARSTNLPTRPFNSQDSLRSCAA